MIGRRLKLEGKLKCEKIILLGLLLTSLVFHAIFSLETDRQIEAYEYQINKQVAQLKDKQEQIEVLEIIIENQQWDASEPVNESEYIGTFTVTHYCPCVICCGNSDGIAYTGTQATEGRTIAVDPEVIPRGAIKGNKIDMYMDSHSEALQAGIVQADVWVIGSDYQ